MFESCICIEPDDVGELLSRTRRTARKQHRCGECRQTIQPRQQYEEDRIVYDGNIEVYKTCIPCLNVRTSLFECGWYYTGIWEAIHETICGWNDDDEFECVCPESK